MFLTIYVGMLCPHKVHCNSLFILSVFQLFTVVRNVKEAHECQEYGEKQEFQDDVDYILDGLQSSQPLPTRCLRYNAHFYQPSTTNSNLSTAHAAFSVLRKNVKFYSDQFPLQCLEVIDIIFIFSCKSRIWFVLLMSSISFDPITMHHVHNYFVRNAQTCGKLLLFIFYSMSPIKFQGDIHIFSLNRIAF